MDSDLIPFDRPDADEPSNLGKLARGTDYFADVGRWPRLLGAAALTPVAAYFLLAGLLTPVAAAHFAWRNEWPLAGLLLGIGAGHGVVGFALAWLARRLWRGVPSANRRTVLPSWLVGSFLVGFLTPMGLGLTAALGAKAWQAAGAGDATVALWCAAGAVGSVAGLWRAYRTFARLVRGRPGG
ncbi:phage holin family protein [Urbifossiella limnaea]|uniref:Uncharacterized protein n=1 Tax=Urbifossiella limnaea TaxID=2528023 RepID=A0A517Y093_9BACT|nr:phage holin family protein [Urbifossiella limnaea]QDU23175.1 hypothetical protein ETAA1_51670 [Urbifossiella limnaea]